MRGKLLKNKILWVTLKILFIIIFNVFFFMIGGTEHVTSVWISYGFIHFSYLSLIFTQILIKEKNNVAFGLPLYLISTIYFLLNLIIGIIFILLQPDSNKIVFLTLFFFAIIYFIFIVISMLVNEDTKNKNDSQKKEIEFIKGTSTRLKILLSDCSDNSLNKKIEKAFELIQSSPSKSDLSVSNIEEGIIKGISNLEEILDEDSTDKTLEIVDNIIKLTMKRNASLVDLNK